VDLKGVAIAPAAYYLGFSRLFEQHDTHEPDVVAEAEDRGLDEVCARSPLPEAPDVERLDELCVKLVGDSMRAP
jgi:hypothetical protein